MNTPFVLPLGKNRKKKHLTKETFFSINKVWTRDGNPQSKFLDQIRIRNLNYGFGLLIFTTLLAFKNKTHSFFHAYFRLGRIKKWPL